MKVKQVYIYLKQDSFLNTSSLASNATIEVPGIGEIKIDAVLSRDLLDNIEKEAIQALKVKLGQKI